MDEQKFCSDCGAANSTRAAFCANCGKTFTSASLKKSDSTEDTLTSNTQFKFCKNCGRKVALNAKFCAGCGADLSEGGGGGEKILSSLNNVATKDGTKTTLLFTTNRIIVAQTLSRRADLASSAVPSVVGILVGAALRESARRKQEQETRTLNLEEIVGAHKKNYAIPYSEITQLRVRKPIVSRMWGTKPGRIALVTSLGVKEFKLVYYKKEMERTLESLGSKLRNRLGDKLIIEN
jgi:RNA polymerase subunit RPABC4/transcription elongation factor Spt4